MQTGVEIVAAERQRQLEVEGWTSERDDLYRLGQLSWAAACYCLVESWRRMGRKGDYYKQFWPWSKKWWKPTPDDRIRELAKAGALICAEIDRQNRLEISRIASGQEIVVA